MFLTLSGTLKLKRPSRSVATPLLVPSAMMVAPIRGSPVLASKTVPLTVLASIAEAKTKEMAAFLKAFNLEKSVLLVMDNNDQAVLRASANIANVSTLPVEQINTYDVVKNCKIVISKQAAKQIEEVYGE